jgi:tRNA threonylcarbamoyl adenosine modification protein YjeE
MGLGLDDDKPLGPMHLEALLEAAEGKDALVLGPGVARGKKTHLLIADLLKRFPGPVVLDADGLNAVAGRLEVLRAAQGPLVLTPHPGEMARLSGLSIAEIQSNRVAVARDFARAHRVVLVLKGARTVVALPDGRARINPTGNPGMATGARGCGQHGGVRARAGRGLGAGMAWRARPHRLGPPPRAHRGVGALEPMSVSFTTRSADKTRQLGALLGRLLQPRDFVALLGELGAGKTEFARGVAEGCAVPPDEVASPTFALIHRYQGRIPLLHMDLFRLGSEEELYGTGYFELRDAGEAAVLVEWADRIATAVPADAVRIRFAEGPGPEERRLSADATGPVSAERLAEWLDAPGADEARTP